MTTETIPEVAGHPPKVLLWFKVYSGFLCFLYFATAAFSLVYFLGDPKDTEMSPTGAHITGALLLVVGSALFGACLLPLVLRPSPWLWTYDLVVICLGMTSVCSLPACIPLLIFWLKPETKRHFGKSIV